MPKATTSKFYRTFVKGLMTEASSLTYPEDTSFDELNTVLSRKGNRTRRFGFNFSPDNATTRTYSVVEAKNEFMWTAVASEPGLSFLVVQNGANVSFYDRSKVGFASTKKSFELNLNDYTRPGAGNLNVMSARFASGKGYLFVVGADIEPLVVGYDKPSDTINVTKISILARDFEGLRDDLANDEEPSILTKEHYYNLRNQGWVTT